MKYVLSKIEHDRDFELVVEWNANPMANIKLLENQEFTQVNLAAQSQTQQMKGSSKGGISLYDCLTWFS
jgi:hypothetical protein